MSYELKAAVPCAAGVPLLCGLATVAALKVLAAALQHCTPAMPQVLLCDMMRAIGAANGARNGALPRTPAPTGSVAGGGCSRLHPHCRGGGPGGWARGRGERGGGGRGLQDVFEDDSNVHMVMELCSGGSILEAIKTDAPRTEADVADIVRCVLRFIAQCHIKARPHLPPSQAIPPPYRV